MQTLKGIIPRLTSWARSHFSSEAMAALGPKLAAWARHQVSADALSALLHVAVLLVLVSLFRPLFFQAVDATHYHASSIFVSMAKADLALIASSAPKNVPVVPQLLTFLVPMALFFVAGRKLRWTDWEHGKALRVFTLGVVLMLCWSGATSPYNLYLGLEHGLDRLLLVACGLLSIRFPIFVPLAVKMSIVMIKEAYVPTPLDDFDFRAPAELVIIFSIFVWASLSRSFKPAHFLVVGIGSFAAFYYLAGIAKVNIGPTGSWLNENHVSNVGMSGYVHGWLSIVPESAFLQFDALARRFDYWMAFYTLFIEVGAIVGLYLFRQLTRWWFLGLFLLNFGIFAMSGICFWKWMATSVLAFVWIGRSGKPLIDRMLEYKLPLLLGLAAIYWSGSRIWYYPTAVAWYDTRLTENYEIYAIGESGNRYLVRGNYFQPTDMHWSQGSLCYATDGRAMTGIYATGSYSTMRALETITPEEMEKRHLRARSCRNKKLQARYDDFMRRFFGNLNRGGQRLTFLNWVGRPRHIWSWPKGQLNDGQNEVFDAQEKVAKVELWMNLVFHHDGKLHRTEPKLTHTVEIPTQ